MHEHACLQGIVVVDLEDIIQLERYLRRLYAIDCVSRYCFVAEVGDIPVAWAFVLLYRPSW